MLLRYPVPLHPYGPSSFIEDAMYLRESPLVGGGVHIIARYSKKLPLTPSKTSTDPKSDRKLMSKKGRRRKSQDRTYSSKTVSPMKSPAKFFQEQGGVEGILQEAARGLYSRGEKWGVAKALRDAVQGLQTGSNSPKLPTDAKIASDASPDLTARIRALEQRNQALAKMLQHAVEDLWTQQKTLYEGEAKSAADAVSLAVAKVQFVQVYLENSTMPFPPEQVTSEESKSTDSASAARDKTGEVADEAARSVTETSEAGRNHSPDTHPSTEASPQDGSNSPAHKNVLVRIQPAAAVLEATRDPPTNDRPGPYPFHHPRPSLTQSSFSWMLGEDRRQSSFVSASPFPSEKRIARGKAGYLFGDDKDEGSKHIGKPKGQRSENWEDETITLDYLMGGADTAD